jgi:hypothetical protein
MHLCTCVSEEGGDGEGAGAEAKSLLSYTLRYVSLAELGGLPNRHAQGSAPDMATIDMLKGQLQKNVVPCQAECREVSTKKV